MARDGINTIICDNILRKFDGNKTISRARLRENTFYANIDADWEVVERHIEFMLEDRTLKEDDAMLSLTNKGWLMLNNSDKIGYVAQKIEEIQWSRSERETRVVIRVGVLVGLGATALWVIVKLIYMLT